MAYIKRFSCLSCSVFCYVLKSIVKNTKSLTKEYNDMSLEERKGENYGIPERGGTEKFNTERLATSSTN